MEFSNKVKEENTIETSSRANSLGERIDSWLRPSDQGLKFNVESAWKNNKGAIGIIVQSASKSIVHAWTRRRCWNSPMKVEATALLLACNYVQSLNIRKAIFESECKVLIDVIQ